MQVLIDKTTRQITGYGLFSAPPADPNTLMLTISDALMTKLQQAGVKVLNAKGDDIAVTPPPVPVPDPGVAKRAATITALKTAAGGTGAMATVAQAILDLGGVG
jgi:hypothetical protein